MKNAALSVIGAWVAAECLVGLFWLWGWRLDFAPIGWWF